MNTQLKQQIRLMEADFKKKDILVHRLVEELRRSGCATAGSPQRVES